MLYFYARELKLGGNYLWLFRTLFRAQIQTQCMVLQQAKYAMPNSFQIRPLKFFLRHTHVKLRQISLEKDK